MFCFIQADPFLKQSQTESVYYITPNVTVHKTMPVTAQGSEPCSTFSVGTVLIGTTDNTNLNLLAAGKH
jgi:hypothetical protein